MSESCCKELSVHLSAYIDGESDAQIAIRIENHLVVCSRCRSCAESIRRVKSLLASAPRTCLPEEMKKRLMNLPLSRRA